MLFVDLGKSSSAGDRPVSRLLPTQDDGNKEESQTYTHAPNWIPTHDLSVRTAENDTDRAASVIGM
jgi:hypothetical protein